MYKIAEFADVSPAECCELCSVTPRCEVYEYRYDDQRLYCLLGYGAIPRNPLFTSPLVWSWASVTQPKPDCVIAADKVCGDSSRGPGCCGSMSFCEPKSQELFMCTHRPAQCARQYPMTELQARDVRVVTGNRSADCCQACFEESRCKAYTFYPEASECRLKRDSDGPRIPHKTATTGYLNALLV
ncbi:hypothetical protein PINS_up020441 [Pythium insidiosum]|nr:hypothetical protein PINS_up020441 [Pythium insidiosum]